MIGPVQERIPIYIAAIGPKNTQLDRRDRRRLAPDLLLPRARGRRRAPLLEEGAARAGRSARRLRHRADGQRSHRRRPGPRPRRHAPDPRALRRRAWARARRTSTTRLCSRYGFEDAADEVQDLYLDGKKDEAAAALPPELIDMVSICGPRDRVKERLERLPRRGRRHADRSRRWPSSPRSACGSSASSRSWSERAVAPAHSCSPRSATRGTPFPAIALGRELARPRPRGLRSELGPLARARRGARACASPRRPSTRSSRAGRAAAEALPGRGGGRRGDTRALIDEVDPDAVVVDILTVAARAGRPVSRSGRWATLVPHVLPIAEPGLPALLRWAPCCPARRLGRAAVGARPAAAARRRGAGPARAQRRARAGRPAAARPRRTAASRTQLALIATFPQLEYPRTEPRAVDAGDRPAAVGAALRRGRAAAGRRAAGAGGALAPPRTPTHALLRAALEGLADEPVRVLATTNRRSRLRAAPRVPPNARLVDWLSYARTMPRCAAVVCHAGHGTVCRALASGVPVVACPAAGDMAENAARVSLGGRSACRCRAACHTPARRPAGGATGAGRPGLRRARARRRLVATGRTALRRRGAIAADELERVRGDAEEAPGVGLEPHNLSVNSPYRSAD